MNMTQFHAGQEVEVLARHRDIGPPEAAVIWRKAKIIKCWPSIYHPGQYGVQFRDGSRAFFDADHIRAEYAQTYPEDGNGSVDADKWRLACKMVEQVPQA